MCVLALTVPLYESVAEALKKIRVIASSVKDDAFVFASLQKAGSPISGAALLTGFGRMLTALGIDDAERRRRNLNLHALRHSFITLARYLGMPDVSVMDGKAKESLALSPIEEMDEGPKPSEVAKIREELRRLKPLTIDEVKKMNADVDAGRKAVNHR
jgi:hypothetical protein